MKDIKKNNDFHYDKWGFPVNVSQFPMPKVKPPKPDEKELPLSSRNSLKGVYKANAKRAFAIVKERTPIYNKFTSK